MPSILEFLKDHVLIRDPSDALFAAGVKAWKRYEETREPQHLAQAVRNHQAALDIRVSGHRRRSKSLFHTAVALWAHCQGAVTKESSSTVIAYYGEALRLELFLPDKPSKLGRRATIHTNLGTVYLTLFRLGKEDPEAFPDTGSNLIGKAIENYRSALQYRPVKIDPDRPISLVKLSIALVQKDSEYDLMNAIGNLHGAVELCTTKPTSRPLLLLSLDNLAQAYDGHYHYSEDISDVVGKVDALRRILDLTDGGKGRLISLLNLTDALWRLCEIEPNRSNDLDEAVLRSGEALDLSDGSDKIIHTMALIILANVLSTRYVQTTLKIVTDLDQAIQYYREAIDAYPEDGPDPMLCSSLASAIYIRCQDFEEVEGATLEDAISYNQEALHTCPKDDPLYLMIQKNLGNIYLTQFNMSEAEDVLVKGIQAYEDVVSHCPDDDDNYTDYLKTLNQANRALQLKQNGETGKVSICTKSKLRRRRSSLRSRQSSDESCPSRPASINRTD